MRSDALWYSDHFSSGILVYLGNKRAFAIGDHLLRLYELIRIVTRVYGPYEFDGSLDELKLQFSRTFYVYLSICNRVVSREIWIKQALMSFSDLKYHSSFGFVLF